MRGARPNELALKGQSTLQKVKEMSSIEDLIERGATDDAAAAQALARLVAKGTIRVCDPSRPLTKFVITKFSTGCFHCERFIERGAEIVLLPQQRRTVHRKCFGEYMAEQQRVVSAAIDNALGEAQS